MLAEVLDPELLCDAVYGHDHTFAIGASEMRHHGDPWVQVPACGLHTSFGVLHCEAGIGTDGSGLLHCEAGIGAGESLFLVLSG